MQHYTSYGYCTCPVSQAQVSEVVTHLSEAFPNTEETPSRLMRGWYAARRIAKASWRIISTGMNWNVPDLDSLDILGMTVQLP